MAAQSHGAAVAIGNTGGNLCAAEYKITRNTKGLSGLMFSATVGVADGYRMETVDGPIRRMEARRGRQALFSGMNTLMMVPFPGSDRIWKSPLQISTRSFMLCSP